MDEHHKLFTLIVNVQQRVAQRTAAFQLSALDVVVGRRLRLEGLRRRELNRFDVTDDATVAVLHVVVHPISSASRRLQLPLQLQLDADRFHLVHLGDGLAQVVGELASIVLVASVERGKNLRVDLLRQANAKRIIWKEPKGISEHLQIFHFNFTHLAHPAASPPARTTGSCSGTCTSPTPSSS